MYAPCNTPLFGERGLAAATVPALMVSGTVDRLCPNEHHTIFAYRLLGGQPLRTSTNKGQRGRLRLTRESEGTKRWDGGPKSHCGG